MHFKKQQGIVNLLNSGIILFRENGFENTTSRMIAQKADVAQGMMNHYFGTKDFLGAEVLVLLSEYITQRVNEFITIKSDPILYHLVRTRVVYMFLQKKEYHQFYVDSLKYDLYFRYIADTVDPVVNEIKHINNNNFSDDLYLIYSRYLPYMLEKSVVLKKMEDNMFSDIHEDDVPFLVSQTAMEHFIPREVIQSKKSKSIKLSKTILENIDEIPDESFINDFVLRHECDFEKK